MYQVWRAINSFLSLTFTLPAIFGEQIIQYSVSHLNHIYLKIYTAAKAPGVSVIFN